jgi:hypothetical protein
MLINVFGHWINPTKLSRLRGGAIGGHDAYTSLFFNSDDDADLHITGKIPDEVANEINRLILESQRVTSGETPTEILNKIQRNMVNVVQALVINKDSFQPEAHFKESFNVWLDLATKTLKEAGIKTSL